MSQTNGPPLVLGRSAAWSEVSEAGMKNMESIRTKLPRAYGLGGKASMRYLIASMIVVINSGSTVDTEITKSPNRRSPTVAYVVRRSTRSASTKRIQSPAIDASVAMAARAGAIGKIVPKIPSDRTTPIHEARGNLAKISIWSICLKYIPDPLLCDVSYISNKQRAFLPSCSRFFATGSLLYFIGDPCSLFIMTRIYGSSLAP